jgi:Cd2+-exporting ATPase
MPPSDCQSTLQEQDDACGSCCQQSANEDVSSIIANDTSELNVPFEGGTDEPTGDDTSCADACCQKKDSLSASQCKGETTGDNEAACQDSKPACSDSCCGTDEPTGDNSSCADTCCQKYSLSASQCKGETTGDNEAACQDSKPACSDSCCATEAPTTTSKPSVTDCCRGKPFPCCDESCLDRVALRECDDNCVGDGTSS